MKPVALFTCASSPYLALGLDCYDLARDALTFRGPDKVICHPPCRAWGRYYYKAKPREGEMRAGLWALDLVRQNGGVLEHPVSSKLWLFLQPGDATVDIRQADFGHRAEKCTRLFYAKLGPMPPLPPPNPGPYRSVELLGRQERERTPAELARWLVSWCEA